MNLAYLRSIPRSCFRVSSVLPSSTETFTPNGILTLIGKGMQLVAKLQHKEQNFPECQNKALLYTYRTRLTTPFNIRG